MKFSALVQIPAKVTKTKSFHAPSIMRATPSLPDLKITLVASGKTKTLFASWSHHMELPSNDLSRAMCFLVLKSA